jgi:uncharacterized protein YqeY
MAINLYDRISADIKAAMLAKDKIRLEALRNVKKFFLEARTASGANNMLTDDDASKIIRKLVKQGKDAALIYAERDRPELAEAELSQVSVLEEYLPPQLSPEELEAELKRIIADVGATGMQDMGKVMGAATKALSEQAEGRAISDAVRRLLA